MSVTGVFATGRPSVPAPKTNAMLKYLPRPRTPWLPYTFRRENVKPEELAKMWGQGRFRNGSENAWSGYNTSPTTKIGESAPIPIIPRHELEKYMPNIHLGPKALVTPVSMMSARGGHRVTHDLIHSYDPFIGRLEPWKEPSVDHDNITPQDPSRVGLHGDTISCRSRIYRWMRRGPFFNEDHYFRRRMTDASKNQPVENASERGLQKKIIRLAKRGQVKEACQEYRKLQFIPPVAVYRALMAACVPGALLADAIAIFEDGERLLFATRDHEVFYHLMNVAIAADNPARVMWVYNSARGSYRTNEYANAGVEAIHLHGLATKALEYFLDSPLGLEAEASAVYQFITESGLADYDIHMKLGALLSAALAKAGDSDVVDLPSDGGASLAIVQDAEKALLAAARSFYQSLDAATRESACVSSTAGGGGADAVAPSDERLVTLFLESHSDLNVRFVLRLARFRRNVDMMATQQEAYVDRVLSWLSVLQAQGRDRLGLDSEALPYLFKTLPSTANPNVRVVPNPDSIHSRRMLPSEAGATFSFNASTRFVVETLPTNRPSDTASRFLAKQPTQSVADGIARFGSAAKGDNVSFPVDVRRLASQHLRIVHPAVATERKRIEDGVTSDASAAQGARSPAAGAAPSSGVANPTTTMAPKTPASELGDMGSVF